MTFRETFYQVKGLMESRLHDFGLESADASTMGWTTMLSIEQNTRVTIDVPLILIYSDEFLISGTLETSTYSRLNGKTVKLKVGNTVVATTTTNINGEYSFTHTPVSTGNHSFQVIFEGTNIHAASQSSVVNRTVDKETSVINLDGISTQHYGDTVIFGGQLLDNDGQYISSASVKYYLNNSLVTTLTTDAQGRFSTSKSVDSFDTQNIKFIYDGDSNYTNCEGSSQIDVYQPQLSLTSDKDVLSYADNDSATLTVQVQDNAPSPQNLAISNRLITLLGYDDYSGETASDFTDTNNIASISDDNQTIVMYSSSSTNDSNIIHNTTFGSKSMLMSFNINSATISDAGYIAVFNADGTSIIGYLPLSTGQYGIYAYNDSNAVLVIKNGLTLGSINLNGTSSYKIGFYLSETRIVLSDVQVHEIVDSEYTNSSGACTLTYDSQGIGDVFLTAQANINSTLVSETYSIEDMFKYDDATSDKSNKFSFISNPNASSISHQTDYYQVNYTRTTEANPVKINLAEFVCEDDFEASIDVYYTASSTKQFTWKISGNSNFEYNNMSEIGSWSASRILRTFVGTQSYSTNPTEQLPQSTWLTFKFKKQNGNIILQAYNGSTLINEYSSVEWKQSTTIIMGLQISEYISTLRFKNLKVKPL